MSFIPGIIDYSGIIPSPFITEWTVAGDAAARTVTLPISGFGLNIDIDWGDGSPFSHMTNAGDPGGTHIYAVDGIYQVSIYSYAYLYWTFGSFASMAPKITDIINWGAGSMFVGFDQLMQGFKGCVNLKSVATGSIPKHGTGSSHFQMMFYHCAKITTVQGELFKEHTNVTSQAFAQAFEGCSELTTIGTDLFRYNIKASSSSFSNLFFDCVKLDNLPTDLFRYNTLASTSAFSQAFWNCQSLSSIPDGLFDYNINVTGSGFANCFWGCTSLTSIPEDLFRYNIKVGNFAFGSLFYNCPITSIPTDLFRYNVLASGDAFRAAFNFTSITSIPTDLFRYNVLVDRFELIFGECYNLTAIPDNLFKYNTVARSFASCFYKCDKLQVNNRIFCDVGDEGTRFASIPTMYFTSMFQRDNFTGVQGTAPDLWNYTFGGTVYSTSCYGGAGNSLTSLDNYASIPAAWK